jgi:hypothetical protein
LNEIVLPPEPIEGVTIRLKLPTDKTVTRKFAGSESGRIVYLWGIREMKEESDGKLLELDEIELRGPANDVIDARASLEAQNIEGRVMVRLVVIRRK